MTWWNATRTPQWAAMAVVGVAVGLTGWGLGLPEPTGQADEPAVSRPDAASPSPSSDGNPLRQDVPADEADAGGETPDGGTTDGSAPAPALRKWTLTDGVVLVGEPAWRRSSAVVFRLESGGYVAIPWRLLPKEVQAAAETLPVDRMWREVPTPEERNAVFAGLVLPSVMYKQSDVGAYPWPVIPRIKAVPQPREWSVSGDGQRVLVAFPDGLTEVWSIDGTTRLATITPATPPQGRERFPDLMLSTAISHEGRYAYLIRQDRQEIAAWDVENLEVVQTGPIRNPKLAYLQLVLTGWLQAEAFETLDAFYAWLAERPELAEEKLGENWSDDLLLLMIALTRVEDEDGPLLINNYGDVYTRWITKHPETILGRLVSARSDLIIGGRARGGGFAHTVTEAGWRIYREKYRTAYLTLEPVIDQARPPAAAFQMILAIAKGMSFSEEDRMDLVRDLMTHHPTDLQAHDEAAQTFLTRWGGTDGRTGKYIEQVARRVSEKIDDAAGDRVYARLAERFRGYPETEVWGTSKPDAERIIRAVEAMQKAGFCPYDLERWAILLAAQAGQMERMKQMSDAQAFGPRPLDATDRPILAAAKAWPQRYLNAAAGREVDFTLPPPPGSPTGGSSGTRSTGVVRVLPSGASPTPVPPSSASSSGRSSSRPAPSRPSPPPSAPSTPRPAVAPPEAPSRTHAPRVTASPSPTPWTSITPRTASPREVSIETLFEPGIELYSDAPCQAARFSPDGTVLYGLMGAGRDCHFFRWDAVSGRMLGRDPVSGTGLHLRPAAIAVSSDGQRVAFTRGQTGYEGRPRTEVQLLRYVEGPSGRMLRQYASTILEPAAQAPVGLTFLADGRLLADWPGGMSVHGERLTTECLLLTGNTRPDVVPDGPSPHQGDQRWVVAGLDRPLVLLRDAAADRQAWTTLRPESAPLWPHLQKLAPTTSAEVSLPGAFVMSAVSKDHVGHLRRPSDGAWECLISGLPNVTAPSAMQVTIAEPAYQSRITLTTGAATEDVTSREHFGFLAGDRWMYVITTPTGEGKDGPQRLTLVPTGDQVKSDKPEAVTMALPPGQPVINPVTGDCLIINWRATLHRLREPLTGTPATAPKTP